MHPPARYTLTDVEWAMVRNAMHAALIDLAKQRRIVTYSELALMLPVYVHPGSYAFTRLLSQVCEVEEAAGHGMICALVVAKATGVPGAGFFRGAAEWGRDVSDLDRCWRDELEYVFACWSET